MDTNSSAVRLGDLEISLTYIRYAISHFIFLWIP